MGNKSICESLIHINTLIHENLCVWTHQPCGERTQGSTATSPDCQEFLQSSWIVQGIGVEIKQQFQPGGQDRLIQVRNAR